MLPASQLGWILIALDGRINLNKFQKKLDGRINPKNVAHLHIGHLLLRLFNEEVVLAGNNFHLSSTLEIQRLCQLLSFLCLILKVFELINQKETILKKINHFSYFLFRHFKSEMTHF